MQPIRSPACISASPHPTPAASTDFHAAALAAGGKDNGQPGLRTDYGPDYFAAYVIDPDGYRLEAYCALQAKPLSLTASLAPSPRLAL